MTSLYKPPAPLLGVGFGLAQLTCASLAFAGGVAAAAWRLRAFPDPVTLAVLASVGWIAAGRCYTTWSVESNAWAWLSFGALGFCSAWLAGPTNAKWSRKTPLDRRLVFMLLTGFLVRGVWTLLNPCNGRGI